VFGLHVRWTTAPQSPLKSNGYRPLRPDRPRLLSGIVGFEPQLDLMGAQIRRYAGVMG